MIRKDTLDLVTADVTEMTEEEATETRGGYGPAASICFTIGLFSRLLADTEASLEGSGQVIGGGGA